MYKGETTFGSMETYRLIVGNRGKKIGIRLDLEGLVV